MGTEELYQQGAQIMQQASVTFVVVNVVFIGLRLLLKRRLNKEYGKKERR